MHRIFSIVMVVILSTFLLSCSDSQKDKPLKIAITSWIGYSPLFYAQEKGWLSKNDIKLIHVVSLNENIDIYESGNADAFVGTQYEFSVVKESVESLVPVMMFDRSYGADIVMSNKTVKHLQKSRSKIDAYLEMDSINHTILDDFLKHHNIDEKRINYINKDQAEIVTMRHKDLKQPTIVITYKPFDQVLKKSGFKAIASTKKSLDIVVVDGLYTTKQTLQQHNQKFIKLKAYVIDALKALQKDPEAYYNAIESHLSGQSYDAFLSQLHDIKWINGELSAELQERLLLAEFPLSDLL